MKRALVVSAAIAIVALAVVAFLFLRAPSGPRSIHHFDPDRVAALETDMWKAYYGKSKPKLFRLLVTMLHEQLHFSWARASTVGYRFATAASRFSGMRAGYEVVLPDLEKGYRIERDWTGASFDPAAVARAELAWWVARRNPGESSGENVGRLIAEEYALYYGVPVETVARAGLLRARAGRLRDEGGKNADWTEVARLLRESYRDLYTAVGDTAPAELPAPAPSPG